MPFRSALRTRTPRRLALLLLALLPCAGCVANSSNPRAELHAAKADSQHAAFRLDLINPGGRDLVLTRLDYEVSHGESSFPVASGSWSGRVELPAKGTAVLDFDAHFQNPPMEPDSHIIHLSGEMFFVDRTGYLGLRSMDLSRTSFHAQVQAAEFQP